MADRESLPASVREKFATSPESLWPRQPRYAVLMNVRARCLHLPGMGKWMWST